MGITSQLESEFDFDIVEEFIGHFETMSHVLEPTIINLEHEEHFCQHVNELFRIFHNLKSATGFLKVEPMNRMCMIVENALEQARECNNGPASPEFVDWMLQVQDLFFVWLHDFENDNELSSYDPEIENIPDNIFKNG